MSDSAVTLRSWSYAQQKVARWLALGISQSEAARREHIPLRTVQSWVADFDLLVLADELHQRGFERVDPQLWANLENALLIQSEVFRGERPASDQAYLECRRFIEGALGYRAAAAKRRNADGEDSPGASGFLTAAGDSDR